LFFRFLEARYRGEIHELTGRVVTSPIDACNRPRHAGDFHVRVPPSPQALAAFFAGWRGELPAARKWLAAVRHYAMARLADETGLRLAELCGLRLEDLHFGHGPVGKIHVRLGKGSRGSGPRERMVPMLGDARPLLIWWVTEVRGQFADDWELPRAVLFPSERGGPIGGDTFARTLAEAAAAHLRGPVTKLTPHVLRHACASRLYGEGIGLAAIQQLLGHRWLSTTVRHYTWPTRPSKTRTSRRPSGPPPGSRSRGMQWNLRLAAAQRGIWRSSDLRRLLAEAGLEISAGKMSHLWSGRPISVRLDDLDIICAVLGCEPGDLLVRDPAAVRPVGQEAPAAAAASSAIRPSRRGGRSLPPV
jgi:DNA-binding Xre family transcriptional regulator